MRNTFSRFFSHFFCQVRIEFLTFFDLKPPLDVTTLTLNVFHHFEFVFHLLFNPLLLRTLTPIEDLKYLGDSLYLHGALDVTVIKEVVFNSRKHFARRRIRPVTMDRLYVGYEGPVYQQGRQLLAAKTEDNRDHR